MRAAQPAAQTGLTVALPACGPMPRTTAATCSTPWSRRACPTAGHAPRWVAALPPLTLAVAAARYPDRDIAEAPADRVVREQAAGRAADVTPWPPGARRRAQAEGAPMADTIAHEGIALRRAA